MDIQVTVLVFDRISLFELGCATELFALPRADFNHWYQCNVVSFDTDTRKALAGLTVGCERVEKLPPTDLLVVPSFTINRANLPSNLITGIKRHVEQGGRVISFCSGAFLLAELGLLNGRQATTHWQYAEEFKRRYPYVNYRDDVLYTFDGQIGCSAGSAAAIDLGIEVIRQDYGFEYANNVARRLVLPAHRSGGQSQFVERPLDIKESRLSETMDWAIKNLSSRLNIDDLACHAAMSRRTFDRKFREVYGLSPMTWLIERKIEKAKLLLEASELPLELVATGAGFDNAITMRHHFKRVMSITPTRYKELFDAKITPVEGT